MMRNLCVRVLALSAAIGMCCAVAAAQITIPTVPIGNPGNAPDPLTGNLYGSVTYSYNIGSTEVTNAQYAAFLNAKAKSDPFGLYNGNGTSTGMASSFGGITRSGSPGSYTYSTIAGRENNPVNFVSFWDACRFANWLHNGQGNGDTETGAYTLTPGGISANTIIRNAGWKWAVTSEDEWYKAAYHQPASAGGDSDNYWLFPTSSNSVPSASQVNYYNVIGNTALVGSYAANYYGTFDMGGNLWEWNEAVIGGSRRGLRGGGFSSGSVVVAADFRDSISPAVEVTSTPDLGFRVSQAIGLPSCPADYNGSGDAGDILDFLDFIDDFSACEQQSPPCGQFGNPDINGDTFVDILDFLDFIEAFSAGC